jgi:DNA polymerase-1
MGLKPLSTTATGKAQFDMDTLEHLSKTYKWAENLRVYNKLLKIKSTYIDRFLNGHEDGRYYPYFKQNGTVSGRYGSDLQQLPKPKEEGEDVEIIVKYTNTVRAFFISGEGRRFIDDDYSSLEPRIFSSITGDEGLKDIYRNDWDFYSTIAIKTEKLEENKAKYPNGVSPDTKSPIFLKKLDPVKRNAAKAYSLGLAYGMSSYALAMSLGVSKEEGLRLYNGYLNGFPKLREWIENSRAFVKTHGYIKNQVGRIRHLPKVKQIYEKFGDRIMDYKFRKELSDSYGTDFVTKLYLDYKNGNNNCLNFQIQSMAASIVNRSALRINRKAKELGIDAQVIAQIHDQLVIDVAQGQAEMFAPYVQEIMENTVTLNGVILIAEPEIAKNLRDGH